MSDRWIVIPNWEKFQHYADRTPIFIKVYLELLHDDAYRELTLSDRGLLLQLWMLYASARGIVPANACKLSRLLGIRVSSVQLERLNHAAFIAVVASKPLALARARERSREKERDIEKKERGAAPAPSGPASPRERPTFPDYDEPPDPAVAALLRRVTDSIGKP